MVRATFGENLEIVPVLLQFPGMLEKMLEKGKDHFIMGFFGACVFSLWMLIFVYFSVYTFNNPDPEGIWYGVVTTGPAGSEVSTAYLNTED